MSSVEFTILAMPNADFKMRVSGAELGYKQSKPLTQQSVNSQADFGMSGVKKYPFIHVVGPIIFYDGSPTWDARVEYWKNCPNCSLYYL